MTTTPTTCADCGTEIGHDAGPRDGWQLEDGRTVCHACCVEDTKRTLGTNGRLTLTTGTPITTSDVTASTSVYFTPYKGNRIALFNGCSWQALGTNGGQIVSNDYTFQCTYKATPESPHPQILVAAFMWADTEDEADRLRAEFNRWVEWRRLPWWKRWLAG